MDILNISLNRKLHVFAVCFLLVGFPFDNVYSQQPYDIVYQLYYEISKSPSSGDSLIQNNQHLFDNQFHSCLDELLAKFQGAAVNHYQYCDTVYIDPADRTRCRNENEPAKMHHFLRAVDSVIRGQHRWAETMMGQTMIMAEQLVPPAQYLQITEAGIPPLRPQLLCH
jgi:hypothetical protein